MSDDKDQQTFDPEAKLLELHAEFERNVTPLDRLFSHMTYLLAAPMVSIAIAVLAASWTLGNWLAPRFGWRPLDPAPFEGLQAFGAVAALVVATLILAGQRREDQAERRRSQLTLHLAAQSEHKIAKLIELIEEQRLQNPLLPNRDDPEARRMAQPSEPRAVMDRLGETSD